MACRFHVSLSWCWPLMRNTFFNIDVHLQAAAVYGFSLTSVLNEYGRHIHTVYCEVNLHCQGWENRALWRCGQPPLALRWSGQPRCWCRPLQHQSASVRLWGGQGLSISAAGPLWHPWKGEDFTGQSIRSSVTASQAEPGSSTLQQQSRTAA